MLNKIHNIDALSGLKKLEDESIDCIITSPEEAQETVLDMFTKTLGKDKEEGSGDKSWWLNLKTIMKLVI